MLLKLTARSLLVVVVLTAAPSAPVLAAVLADVGDPFHDLGYLAMKDGTRLAYSLYLPTGEGRHPVLLTYNPYIGGGLVLELGIGGTAQVAEYLRHGYGVLSVNMRGTGCSEGAFAMLGEIHVADGAEVVEWAGEQEWSNGRIGLWGNSFPGMGTYLVAAGRPKYLKAMAAGASIGDGYRDTVYPGGIFNAGQFAQWSLVKQPWITRLGIDARLAAGDEACRATLARQPHNAVYRSMKDHPLRDEWWKGQSLLPRAEKIVVPTFVIHGWQDQQVGSRAALDLFRSLQAPKKMLLGNGGHGFYTTPAVQQEVLRWFDHWLKDEDNGIDREPPLTVRFETGRDGSARREESFADWPPEVVAETFFLTASERLTLVPDEQATEAGEKTYLYPSTTELVHDAEVFSQVPAGWGAITYRSDPVESDLQVLGRPVLTFHVSSTEVDTDFMVAVHDIYPDGQVQFVQRGFLRASHRRLDEAQSRAFDPILRHDREEELEPGKIYELTLGLLPVGHTFRRGHRLELVVTAPPPVHFTDDHWGFVARTDSALNTVYHSRSYPSRLVLPRLSGAVVEVDAPACEALAGQPCRPPGARAPETVIQQYEKRRAQRDG